MRETRPKNRTSDANRLTTYNHTHNNKGTPCLPLPRWRDVRTQSHKTASQPSHNRSKQLEVQPKLKASTCQRTAHPYAERRVASGQQDPTGPEESVVEEMPHQCTLRPRGPRSKWRPTLAASTVVGLQQPEQCLQEGNDAKAPPLPEPARWIWGFPRCTGGG